MRALFHSISENAVLIIFTFFNATARRPVGFDIEWRVFFYKNAPQRPAATVQLADRRMILVLQLSSMDRELPLVYIHAIIDGNRQTFPKN